VLVVVVAAATCHPAQHQMAVVPQQPQTATLEPLTLVVVVAAAKT
jgi:hypothetical protein